MRVAVEPLPGAPPCELGEGPVWDAAAGELVWVDILAGVVHRLQPGGGAARRLELDQSVGAVALAPDGGLVAAVADGFAALAPDGRARPLNAFLHDQPDLRMNDGKCDPAGRFVAGTTSLSGRAEASALHRLEDDGGVTTLLSGVSISNGLAWSADGTTLFFVDTPTRAVAVHAYDPDAAPLMPPLRRLALGALAGIPDGMAIDADGDLWIAFWDGGCVRCLAPDGEVLEVVSLPVANVTSCAFGGPDLRTLYVTTARHGRTPQQLEGEPLAGRVFHCRPGVAGAPVAHWRGLERAAGEDAAA